MLAANLPGHFLGSANTAYASQDQRDASWRTEFDASSGAFRATFDHAAIGKALVDLDGRWLKVNRALCQIVGYSEAELLATDFQTITHPDDLDSDLALARQLLDGELDHYHMEKRYLHKQGQVIWILLTASLVRDSLQRPCYFVSQIQDVTQRKRTDETAGAHAVQAVPQRTAPIVTAAVLAPLLIGGIVLVGWLIGARPFQTLTPGLASMKVNTAISFLLVGSALGLFTLPKRRPWQSTFARAAATGAALIGGLTIVEHAFHFDLGIDEFLISGDEPLNPSTPPGRPAPATAGCFLMLGVALLLLPSQRPEARRLLQWLVVATFLVSVLALAGYVYGVDSLYRVPPFGSMAVHTAMTIAIVCVGMLHARTDFGLMIPLRSPDLGGTVARKLLPAVAGVPLILGWFRLQGQQLGYYGTEFGLALHSVASIFICAMLVWWGARSLNIADARRRKVEQQFGKHRDELAHALRVNTMGEMAAGIAHELNQPLSAIANYARGSARRLRDGTGDKTELIEVADSIVEESTRAAEIIRALRRSVNKSTPQQTLLGVNTVVQRATQLVAGEARDRGAALQIICADGLPQVRGDQVQLTQVIVNLLRNGLDALQGSRGEKLVTIETRLGTEGAVEILVTDRGCGLPAENPEGIFEAFFTTKPHGLGMGLAISRSIIEAHGGRLWAEPIVPVGAVFRFLLPAEHGLPYAN